MGGYDSGFADKSLEDRCLLDRSLADKYQTENNCTGIWYINV